MNLRNPWIVLHRYFVQISMDCAILTQNRNAIAMAFGYLVQPLHALQMK